LPTHAKDRTPASSYIGAHVGGQVSLARFVQENTRMVDKVYVELYEDTSKAVPDAIDDLVARTSRGLSADS
jgi:hypothetical protein